MAALKTAIKFALRKIKQSFASNVYVKLDKENVNRAEETLRNIYEAPMTTCYGENTLNPVCDLQIIIPAYNVEKYIGDCLESVVKLAGYDCDFCVTVINDGSTDDTANILEKYRQYRFIEIITQENGGLSNARNTALRNVKGRYVLFVDSDDIINEKNVSMLLKLAKEHDADMALGTYSVINENGKRLYNQRSTADDGILSDCRNLNGYPWGKLVKCEYFKNLIFPEKYWFEDTIIAWLLFDMVKTVYYVNNVSYYYRVREGSITSSCGGGYKSLDGLYVFNRVLKERDKFGLQRVPLDEKMFLNQCLLIEARVGKLTEDIKKNVFVLLCDLYSKYKNELRCERKCNGRHKRIKKYLSEGNYGKFCAMI